MNPWRLSAFTRAVCASSSSRVGAQVEKSCACRPDRWSHFSPARLDQRVHHRPVDNAKFNLCQWNFVFRTSRATLARLPLYCFCGVRATHKCLPFLQFLREFWPMPLPLMIHSALALFGQRTRIPTSARSIGFCVIWVCISSSSVDYFAVAKARPIGLLATTYHFTKN